MRYVNEVASEEELDLEARLIDLDTAGLVKLHNKGVVVDDNKVLLRSVNWNEYSPTRNRGVGLIIDGDVVKYYSDAFLLDWYGAEDGVSWTSIVIVVVSALAGLIFIRAMRRKKM